MDPRRVADPRRTPERLRQVRAHDRPQVAHDRDAPRRRGRGGITLRQRHRQDAGPVLGDRHPGGRLAREAALREQRPRAGAGVEQRREPVVAGLRGAQGDRVVAPLVVAAVGLQPRAGAGRCAPGARTAARSGLPERDAVAGCEHLEPPPAGERDRQPPGRQLVPAPLAGRRGVRLVDAVLPGMRGVERAGAERGRQHLPAVAAHADRQRAAAIADPRAERAIRGRDRPRVVPGRRASRYGAERDGHRGDRDERAGAMRPEAHHEPGHDRNRS